MSHIKIFDVSYGPMKLDFLIFLEYFKMRFGIQLYFWGLNLTQHCPSDFN